MTTPKLTDLSPDEKRILAAQACGWDEITNFVGYEPGRIYVKRTIPYYRESLDAMHDAENMLDAHQRFIYLKNIASTKYELDDAWEHCHATAAQRLDAFLIATGKATV